MTLIQLPNSSYGEQKRESVERFLETKGITTSNGKLAILLSDEKVIKNNINGFAPVRSVSTVKMAIINTFTKYLNIKPANKGIILILNLIINNSDVFGEIINIVTEKYKPIHELEVDFINYPYEHEDEIEYFWKNCLEHMNTNFDIMKKDGYTFQPDFLIQFKDGRIGIFDTKAGKGFN